MGVFEFFVYAVIGTIGGVLSGLIGVGGGVFFVPALVLFVGWNITDAVAASLIVIIFSSLSGTLRNQRSRDPADWKWTALFSLAVAPASLIGVAISRFSADVVVEVVFALLLLALAVPTARGRKDVSGSRANLPRWVVFACGIFIGALSGLVGVGGGVMMVPLMVLGLGLTAKKAVSTSLAVVMFTGIVASLGYLATGFDRLAEVPVLIVFSMIGAWIGVKVRDPLPDDYIRVGFAVFMVAVSLRILSGAVFGF